MARVRRVIDHGVSFYEHQVEKDDGVKLFRGHARFVDEHRIECNGETIEFTHALIAAGARPRIPELPGLDTVPFATSDDLLQATELPEHLVCLGGGPVALEFGQAYRRFGGKVTIAFRAARLVSGEDAELTALLQRYLEEEGIEVVSGFTPARAELNAGRPSVVAGDGRRVTGDRLLVAFGRLPNVGGFGLEEIGVRTAASGVLVDAELRTSLTHVYAVGDATGGLMFTHVATYEAPLAIANMLDGAGLRPDYRVIPRAIFTAPELAGVGPTEEHARLTGREVEIRRYDVHKLGRARAIGDARGRIKFVLDATGGQILGAHMLAPHGAELLPGPMVAMNAGRGTLEPLLQTIHAHPTLSEAVKIAAREG